MQFRLLLKTGWRLHASLVLLLLVFTRAGAQNLTISEHEAPLEKLLTDIRQQSGYNFLYNAPMMASAKPVSVHVTNSSVDEVLKLCFADQPLDYTIKRNTIIIHEKSNQPPPPEDITVTGRVTNENNEPLPGVSIGIKGTGRGATTDGSGNFVIKVSKGDDVLVFSYVGFTTKEVPVNNRTRIDVTLNAENKALGEVVVVAYGQQTKSTLTGAVTAIKSAEILTTKNENITNMLTGKLAGVRIQQKSSEPGTYNNTFDIRGFGNALFVVDGVPRDNMAQLDPEDIESVSVLKDASASVYGVRAANGVVLITTKKGKEGTSEIHYSANFGIQTPIGSPKSTSAADWMTLANEQSMHVQSGGNLRYSLDDIQKYRDGTLKGSDWYHAVIRPSAPMAEHNLSATGGTDKIQYYTSLGYLTQSSFLRSNSNDYKRYNIRSNITAKITNRLKVDFMLSGIYDKSDKNFQTTDWIIRSMERSAALQPIYANGNKNYLQNGWVDGSNPVAMADARQSGYINYTNKWFQSSATLSYDVPGITGLSAKGMFAYDYQIVDNNLYQRAYNLYNYDSASTSYQPVPNQSPSTIDRQFYTKQRTVTQFSLNYNRTFNNVHNLSVLALYEGEARKGDNIYAQRNLSLAIPQLSAGNADAFQIGSMSTSLNDLYDYARMGYVGRVNYNYKGKYLAEFAFRYDGSSIFDPSNHWGFFPSGQLGWRFTDENFWKSWHVPFIDNAKLRATYGLLGDDGAAAYQWLTGYNYPASGSNNQLPGGSVFDGSFVNSSVSTGIPNKNITWSTSKTFDAGIDVNSKNGVLGLVVDYFRRNRTGLIATRLQNLPTVVGASLPQENLDGDLTHGIDVEINHHYHIGQVQYYVKATFGYTRTKYTDRQNPAFGSSYAEWKSDSTNRYSNIQWVYKGIGQFQSYDEIANSKVKYSQNTLPGDYKYADINGDGVINDNDRVPIIYGDRPLFNYGLTVGANYKGFDVNLLFQGAAHVWVNYVEILAGPMWGSNFSNSLEMFMDRWHPADPTANPYDPNTKWIKGKYAYTGSLPDGSSTFSWQNASYLRLKTIELGYTIPAPILRRIGVKGARFYGNIYNVHTWSKMKFIDPEHPSDSYGNVYPLDRTYNMGFNITL
jgi:TonB-linked SusC/RagA family outer membrane protein